MSYAHFKPLTLYIGQLFGEQTGKAVAAFFKNAGLPEPGPQEFFESFDSGIMVFLQEEACVLRFASHDFPQNFGQCDDLVVDEDVLQPIGVRNLSVDRPRQTLTLEIMPGVPVGLPQGEYARLIERLANRNIASMDGVDSAYRNGGRLPDGKGVILDRGAVYRLKNAVRSAAASLDRQDEFYGSLKKTFNEAWSADAPLPDRNGLRVFWSQCRDMKRDGTLVAGWRTPSSDVYEIAECYHKRRLGALRPAPILERA